MSVITKIDNPIDAATLEKVLLKGDLASLNETQRISYYKSVCESVGLNPLTKPFEYISLNNKLTLYATKSCTDQLRMVHKISISITARDLKDGVYIVTARASGPDGRHDESTGVVAIGHLKGDALANSLMKAETKAKRRVTLSICGLAMLDESEVESIPIAQKYNTTQTKPEAITATIVENSGEVLPEIKSSDVEPIAEDKKAFNVGQTIQYGLEKNKIWAFADIDRLWATWGWILHDKKTSAPACTFVHEFKEFLGTKGIEPSESKALEAHEKNQKLYNKYKAPQKHFKDKEPELDLPF